MKLSLFFVCACMAMIAMSCNVTESIVFNDDMSGNYKTIYDLSPMMAYASANRPDGIENEIKPKMDTIMRIDDLLVQYKDSIASLTPKEQEDINRLRGMVFEIHQDDANGVSNYAISKSFRSFEDLMSVGENLDNASNMIFDYGGNQEFKSMGANSYKQGTKVTYNYDGNVFERINYKEPITDTDMDDEITIDDAEVEAVEISEENVWAEDDGMEYDDASSNASDEMAKQIETQFEELFKQSYYTVQYTFPRSIKSVSSDLAEISEDRKSLTLKVDLNAINKDDSILNLKVELED